MRPRVGDCSGFRWLLREIPGSVSSQELAEQFSPKLFFCKLGGCALIKVPGRGDRKKKDVGRENKREKERERRRRLKQREWGLFLSLYSWTSEWLNGQVTFSPPPPNLTSAVWKVLEILKSRWFFFGYTHISEEAATQCPPQSSDLTQEICYCFLLQSSCSSSHGEFKSESLEAF